ncbi:MAG: family 10 glycosylhydrolase, partial [Oscillospiraceae bacterium]
KYMIKHTDGRWWLKPGNPEVQKLIVDGAKEIAQKYPIDGVHIDDYFYATDPSTYGDTQAQAKANTTAMVKGLYSGLKSINPKCLFGVSPAGGFGKSQSLPDSDRKYLSTDLKKWCQNAGYIDYVIPQIYWDYNHETAGYGMVLNKWKDFVTSPSVELYSGIAAYKVNLKENPIKKESIPKQIADSMNGKANGYAIYRFDHLDDY